MNSIAILIKWAKLNALFLGALVLAVEASAQPQYFIDGGTSGNTIPFNLGTFNQRQLLFYSSDFPGTPPGYITTIYFKSSAGVSANFTNLKIMMGPTTLNTLITGPIITTGLDTVLFASSYSTSSGANNWVPFQLQTPFFYDGSSNFLVLASQGGYAPGFTIQHSNVAGRSLYGNTSTNTGTSQNVLPDFGFDLTPLTPPNDAGIIAIILPSSIVSPGQESIVVSLKSFGTDTLTSINVGWSVNGLVQTPASWVGSLSQFEIAAGVTVGSFNFPLGVHTLKAWSYMPNGVVDTLGYNDTITKTIKVCNLLSGTYTIGGALGDYPSVQAAVDAMASCGISGPTTFQILPGTYNEQITIPPLFGASALNRVTFQSITNNPSDVVIANTASSSGNYTIRIDGADYIDLRNLTIKANHASLARVIELTGGAEYNIISGCVIYSNPQARNTNTSAGIYSGSTLDHGNIITENVIQNGYYSIYMYGQSSTELEQGTIIENNTMEGFYYYGVYLYNQHSPKLIGNTITNYASSANVFGVYSQYCQQELDFSKNRLNIAGSSATYGNVYGIYLLYNSASSDIFPGLVSNNFITVSGTNATLYGMHVTNSNYLFVYHNSIVAIGGSSESRSVFYNYGANNRNVNNIIVNYGPGYSAYFLGNSLIASDYNDLYSSSPNLAYHESTTVANLAALKIISGMDMNSVSLEPQFATNTLLYPSNVSLNNLGIPLSHVPYDINGKPRDPLSPDMGAAEFTPTNNDVGISFINQPGAITSSGSNSISGTIKNFGLSNLTLATLYFSVNGGVPVSYLWTGNLSPGNEIGPIVIGSHVFSYGTHQLKVWVGNPNGQSDPNNWNDTLVKSVYVCDLFNGNYTIGPIGSGANYTSFAAALSDLNSCGVAGPTTFNVLPGIYNEQITIGILPGVSGFNTVTFQSITGIASDVIIQYEALSAADNWVVRLDGADYITLQNLTLKAADQNGTFGRVVDMTNGSDYNTIAGNIIMSIPTATVTSAVGIYSSGTNDQFNVLAGNTILGGYYGIYMYGSSNSMEQGNLVVGNIIQDFHYYGIYAGYQDAPVISENVIISRANTSTVAYGIYGHYNDNATLVTKNRINTRATTSNYALYMYYCNGALTSRGLVANNFITQSLATSPANIYGLYNNNTTNFDFFHNSVNILASLQTGYAWYHAGSATANCQYINNMFVNMGGGYAAYVPAAALAGITAMDFNNYYCLGTNLAYMGSAQTNLAGIQNATLMNYNSISANPLYQTTTDLYPTNISLNNLGTPLASVPSDIDGVLRNVLTPDIGAAEFEPPQNDAGISAIISPVSPISPGIQTISATIKNYGVADLLTVNVNWNIDGGVINSQLWTGQLTTSQESSPVNLGNFTFTYGQHILKVWTSNPNGSSDPTTSNDTMIKIINTCDFMTGTFTIGGMGSDFGSFSTAIAAMNICGIGGPVTFNVQPGIYTEQVTIPEIPGASAAYPVVFQSSTGINSDVTIQYTPLGASDNWVIRLDGADYITLQHMTLKTASGATTYGRVIELINGANHNTINGNMIESVQGTTSNTTGCIYSGSSLDEYNVISSNVIRYGYQAVSLDGSNTASMENGNMILDNFIDAYYYYGINTSFQRNIIISGNTINNASNSGGLYAVRPYYCYDGSFITKNRITLTGPNVNYGIYAYAATGTSIEPGLIANNIINQTTLSTGALYMLYFLDASYMRVYHNTLRAKSTAPNNYGVYISSGNTNMKFANNIVANEGSGYTIYGTFANLQNMSVCNYNNFYHVGSNMGYAGATLTNLAAWQTATGFDANSISLSPGFLGPFDLTPSSVNMNNLGTPLLVVPDDINGVLRSISTPDMGAIEFDPVVYEAAHLGFTQPTSGCDIGLMPVSILIRNQGSVDINGGLIASYQIAGSTSVISETISALVPSGVTYTYTFTVPVDLTVASDSIFSLISWINLTGDPISTNDTAAFSLRSMVSPPPPQVTNVSIQSGQSATLNIFNPDSSNLYFWYDVPVGGIYLAIDTTFTTPPLYNNTVYYVEATEDIDPGYLQTTMAGGNSFHGTMFDLTAKNSLTIDSFFVHTLVSGTMEVYYKLGSYAGHEQHASAWTLIGSTQIFSAGGGNNTVANVGGIQLLEGHTYGLYLTLVSGSFQYTNGNGSNQYYEDSNIILESGAGVSYPFNNVFANRVWNGTIHYSLGNRCASIRVADTVFVGVQTLSVDVGADISICQGDTAQLSGTVNGGVAPYAYAWSPASGLSNASVPNPMAFPSVNTTYSLTVTDQNSDTGTDDIIVTVEPLPNVVFPALPSVDDNAAPFSLMGGTPAGGTYSGPGVVGGIFDPALAGVGSHTITYSYTDPASGCTGSATSVQQVTPYTGIGKLVKGRGIDLWPNPSAGLLILTINTQDVTMKLEVVNVQGKVVLNSKLINACGRHELDLTSLPEGVYHIRLTGDTESYIQKIILL